MRTEDHNRGECGHATRSAWFLPTYWDEGKAPEIVHCIELTDKLVKESKKKNCSKATIQIGKEIFMTDELVYEPIDGSPKKSKYGRSTMAMLATQYAKFAKIELPQTFDASEWAKPLGSMYRYFGKDADKTIMYMKKAIEYFEEKNLSYTPHTLDRNKTMMDKWIRETENKKYNPELYE